MLAFGDVMDEMHPDAWSVEAIESLGAELASAVAQPAADPASAAAAAAAAENGMGDEDNMSEDDDDDYDDDGEDNDDDDDDDGDYVDGVLDLDVEEDDEYQPRRRSGRSGSSKTRRSKDKASSRRPKAASTPDGKQDTELCPYREYHRLGPDGRYRMPYSGIRCCNMCRRRLVVWTTAFRKKHHTHPMLNPQLFAKCWLSHKQKRRMKNE